MSFERTIEKNSIQVTTNKDFMLSTEINVESCEDALQILSSKRNRKITSAENKNGEIFITRHYCTCPFCGKRLSAYANSHFSTNPCLSMNIDELCDNQLSLFQNDKTKIIHFNQPMKIENSVKCPHCGGEGIISNEMVNCVFTVNQNQLSITRILQSFSEITVIDWLPKELMIFDDMNYGEKITFNLIKGTVTASLNCENKTLCTMPIVSAKSLRKNDPWLQMFGNKRIFREIKRSFEKMYGAIPFQNEELTVDNLILLTKFVGYNAEFYRDLPLSIDDETTLLPNEFVSISERLHYAYNVPSVFSVTNIPNTKSVKRIVFNRPSVLLYEKELERLWKIIDNIDLYCDLLTGKNTFAILAYLHLYPGIDIYLVEVRKSKSVVWLKKMLDSQYCNYLCWLGGEYLASNSTIRRNLLKNNLRDIRYGYGHYFGKFYFSVPMSPCLKNSTMTFGFGFQFVFLSTLMDYHIAGKELNNCLNTYLPDRASQVYVMRKSNKILAAIEVSENQIVQAYSKNNTPISSKLFIDAITVWAEYNSYSIDDDVFGLSSYE